MTRLTLLVSHEDRQRVARAVADAESRTSAEIVPVLAESSGRYDRPEDLVGVWFGLAALTVVWQFLPESIHPGTGDWGRALRSEWHVVLLGVAVAVGFVAGAVLASRIPWLRRLCTTQAEMQAETVARANQMFFDQRIHHTAAKGGVLIYVSLYERTARVVADRQVVEKLGDRALDLWRRQLMAGLHQSGPIPALCQTIEEAGRALGAVLPRERSDLNELPDALVIVEDAW